VKLSSSKIFVEPQVTESDATISTPKRIEQCDKTLSVKEIVAETQFKSDKGNSNVLVDPYKESLQTDVCTGLPVDVFERYIASGSVISKEK